MGIRTTITTTIIMTGVSKNEYDRRTSNEITSLSNDSLHSSHILSFEVIMYYYLRGRNMEKVSAQSL